MRYSLKLATKSDTDFIFRLKKQTLKEHIDQIWGWDDEFQRQTIEKEFIEENNFLISLGNDLIGLLEIDETDEELHIVELEILPEYQGQGLGSEILQDIIVKMKDKGKRIRLGCFYINKRALKLYEKNGFKKYGETKTHILMEV